MIQDTLYVATESERKQVSMPAWAVNTLQRWAAPSSMTKGIIAYEALMLANDGYEDVLTEIEAGIDAELGRARGTDILGELNKIKFCSPGAARGNLHQEADYADPTEVVTHVNVHIPAQLDEQLTGRGLGNEIADALAVVESSPWSSRTERMIVKQQVAALSRGDSVDDPHIVTQSIMDGPDDSPYDDDAVTSLRDAVYGVEWYKRPSVTVDDLRERGDDIPQSRRHRVPALQAALNNYDGPVTHADVVDWSRDAFGCVQQTADKYADEVNFAETGGVVIDFVSDGVAEIADMLRESIGEDHPVANKPDHELLYLDESVYDVDGTYPTQDEAVGALDALMEIGTKGGAPSRNKARQAFFSWVDQQIDVLLMSA